MFHIGQKVVCVNDAPPPSRTDMEPLILNKIYEIKEIVPFPSYSIYFGEIAICVKIQKYRNYWHQDRFKPLIEKKTDISTFNKILNKVNKGQKVKESAFTWMKNV